MRSIFEVAAGTIAGADHLRAGRNSHDAFQFELGHDRVVAVVCDGCGSAEHSEVGAKIGARLVARAMMTYGNDWSAVQQEVLARLAAIAEHIGAIGDYFLFTILAAVIDRETTSIAAAGDGLVLVNGEQVPLPAVTGNAPPYLGYALTPCTDSPFPAVSLQPVLSIPTPSVRTLLLASDGAERFKALDELLRDDAYYRNPDAVRRRLFMLNRRPPGMLPDDTTVVAIRRRSAHAGPITS